MFHTLSGATLKKVNQNALPAGVQLPIGNTTRFCGARARSVTGCLTCRKRKKKCDEGHPICGSCKARDTPCEWPKEKVKSPTSRREKPSKKHVAEDELILRRDEHRPNPEIVQSQGSVDCTVASENVVVEPPKDRHENIPLSSSETTGTSEAVSYNEPSELPNPPNPDDSTEVAQTPQSGEINPPTPISPAPTSLKPLKKPPLPSLPPQNALLKDTSAHAPSSSREKMKIDYLDNAPEDFRVNEVVQELEGFKEDLTNFQMALEQSRLSVPGENPADIYNQDQPEQQVFIPTEFLASFGFPYVFNLDKEGMVFLECYREQYSTFVSIGLDTSNYFLKTFLSIAASNEAITYALTAWGGFFLELRKPRSDFTKPWEYMQKATKCMCAQMGDYLKPTNKDQFFVLFVFYLIFIGIEVCTGDVGNWRGFMTQCSLLIQSYGGLLRVSDLFGYSNDIKWLISDFKFHDLLSSKCLIDGPIFPVHEYEKALAPRPEYGIDPLHGIVGPLYDILANIGTAKADFAREWAELEQKFEAKDPRAGDLAGDYYHQVNRTIQEFRDTIRECKPSPVHMELLKENDHDRTLHLGLFELYAYVCQLQLATSLEKMPPNTVSQQHLLHRALKVLDFLQATKLKVALSLSLLVCGMTCCSSYDRDVMTRRFRAHVNQYEIGNLQRIEETVVEAWECNPTGSMCIDWPEFVREKEWHLYVG